MKHEQNPVPTEVTRQIITTMRSLQWLIEHSLDGVRATEPWSALGSLEHDLRTALDALRERGDLLIPAGDRERMAKEFEVISDHTRDAVRKSAFREAAHRLHARA